MQIWGGGGGGKLAEVGGGGVELRGEGNLTRHVQHHDTSPPPVRPGRAGRVAMPSVGRWVGVCGE